MHTCRGTIGLPPPDVQGLEPSEVADSDVAALIPACSEPLRAALAQGATVAGVRTGVLRLYGRSIRINPATIDFSRPPTGAARRIAFGSLAWLLPLAQEALATGSVSDRRLVVDYIRAFWRTSRDPGSATEAARERADQIGWGEATNRRRQQTLNCLVQFLPSRYVRALLNSSIRANLDPKRYAGLPNARPHNHGLQANLVLLDSAAILGRPSLAAEAERRLLADVQEARDRGCGIVFEQSAHYHAVNARLWASAAARLTAAGRTAAGARVAAAAAQMRRALEHLLAPDGSLPPVGDSNPEVLRMPSEQPTRRLLCPAAGWAIGRTGWAPTATHYTLRFGPATVQHGHNDHGSITWWPGIGVLSDPGYYYFADERPDLDRYAESNAAHNVLAVAGVEFDGPTALVRRGWRASGDTYVVRDAAPGVTRARSLRIDSELPLIVVLDRATATRRRRFTQRWHLAAGWRRTDTPGVVSHGTATAGVIAIDLATRRRLPPVTATAKVFPTNRTVGNGLLLAFRKSSRSVAILAVVYRSDDGTRPTLRWSRADTPGTGTLSITWADRSRTVAIDELGIRA